MTIPTGKRTTEPKMRSMKNKISSSTTNMRNGSSGKFIGYDSTIDQSCGDDFNARMPSDFEELKQEKAGKLTRRPLKRGT